jgi:tetraacyldisaccharide 4'-kinase
MTVYIARLARELGHRPVIVSRGYGGQAGKRVEVVSDGQSLRLTAGKAGDEPAMMAHRLPGVPVIVARDRYAGGRLAVEAFAADVVILDDGYQHLALRRDLDLLLLDAARPFGNGHLLPRGTLREPLNALGRADAVMLTRCTTALPPYWSRLQRLLGSRPVFTASHQPYRLEDLPMGGAPGPAAPGRLKAPGLGKRRVYGFSGIARNDDFRQSLTRLAGQVAGFSPFRDHHRYDKGDLERIGRQALAVGAELICTTEKDAVRLGGDPGWPLELVVLGVEIKPAGDAFPRYLAGQLATATACRAQ